MSNKTIAQLLLGVVVIIVVTVSYYKFFGQKEDIYTVQENEDTQSDQIEGIEYISNDANGNSYTVRADNGKNETENSNLITLYSVEAVLKFDKKEEIVVTSKKAIYNTINNDTDFMDDVNVKYGKHNVYCDKIIAKFSENYAKLFGNLIYKDISTNLYADQMEIDLFNRTSKTSMFDKNDKVKITKNNGIN